MFNWLSGVGTNVGTILVNELERCTDNFSTMGFIAVGIHPLEASKVAGHTY